MRSQQEILEKIDGLAKIIYKRAPKKDPFYQQYKILVHKLTWDNALQFIAKEDDKNEQSKKEWEKGACLDKKVLIAEIKEQCDLGAMHVCGNDIELAFFVCTGMLAQFWLLGPAKDKALKSLWADYLLQENIITCCERTYRDVCNELQFDWERMKLCYSTGMFSRLADKYGKHFKMKQDQEIAQAIHETSAEFQQGKLAIVKDKEERNEKRIIVP